MKSPRKIKVLFVENDKFFRSTYSEFLESEGYFVFPYRSSESCKRDVEAGLGWDIAIVDRELDIRGWDDGSELIKYLHECKKDNPIISISGYENYGLPSGANILLIKPFFPDKLLKTLKSFDYLFLNKE